MNVQPTNDQVDTLFERYLKPGSPGCALAVVKDGQIVYRQGYGLADLEHGVPMLPTTVFNIGSTAKQFTAFAIALLEDEGKLSFDDDLRKYLPEMYDYPETITIRHLIHHTSGLRGTFPELLALAEWRQADATTTEDVYRLLTAQRELNFRPGDEFLYVNSNYTLLALICERVSGQSFAAFCKDRIFDPLGMTRTVVNDFFMKIIPDCAGRYYEDGEGGWLNARLTDSVIGPTNVYSTVEDLARWDENFYSGQVGGPAVVAQVHQPGRLNDGTELDYAFGLMVGPTHRHRGWQVVEHGGEHGGHCSWMVRFPELHLSAVALFNHFLWEMQDYALKVADIFLEDNAASPMPSASAMTPASATAVVPEEPAAPPQATTPVELSAERLEEVTGAYFNAARAALRDVTITEGRLQYEGLNLVPMGENRFFFEVEPGTHVEFVPAAGDTPARLRTITPSGIYEYDRVERVSPTPEDLAQYAGRYYSPELDIYWTIEAGDGCLVARRRKYVDSRLTPLFVDGFSDDWLPIMGFPTTYLVLFERDDQSIITSLRVSGTRVRNLRFARVDT